MSYQSAGASKNLKRLNIASFFGAGVNKAGTANATAKPSPSKQSPESSVKPDTSISPAAKGSVTSTRHVDNSMQLATQATASAATSSPTEQQQESSGVKEEDAKAEANEVTQLHFPATDGTQDAVAVQDAAIKAEHPDGAVLNPDDGGGIGKGLHCYTCC